MSVEANKDSVRVHGGLCFVWVSMVCVTLIFTRGALSRPHFAYSWLSAPSRMRAIDTSTHKQPPTHLTHTLARTNISTRKAMSLSLYPSLYLLLSEMADLRRCLPGKVAWDSRWPVEVGADRRLEVSRADAGHTSELVGERRQVQGQTLSHTCRERQVLRHETEGHGKTDHASARVPGQDVREHLDLVPGRC